MYAIVRDRQNPSSTRERTQKMGHDDYRRDSGDIADATRKGIDRSREAAQQLGDRAGEYYEATRTRAGELYSQAAEKVTDMASSAREAASRQGGTLSAAIDA